jgi:hypothetical protein
MRIVGDYHESGYAHLQEFVSPEITQAFLRQLKDDLGPAPIPLSRAESHPNLLTRPAFEVYGHFYKPMLYFLWGLTPIVSDIVGCKLLPTYDYLRVYRKGDICRVHSDRQSCEHSLSLTLDYSEGEIWDLQVGKTRIPEPSAQVDENFGPDAFASIPMQVGDAVLYKGVNHRHGRTDPNPNSWSAHLFLHWVDPDGPYRDHGFDGRGNEEKVTFSFS